MAKHHHCGSDIQLEDIDHERQSPEEIRRAIRIRRVIWFALIVNAGMFIIEIIAAYRSGSVALQADAVDFFSDASNYAISLLVLGSTLAVRAKAAIFKGFCMGVFGLFVIANALVRVWQGEAPEASIMGMVAILALLANLSVTAALFAYRDGDSNLRSVWLCSRNDAVANIAVLLAAAGVFASGTRWPDLAVALFISSLSLSAAFQVIRQARQELALGESEDQHHDCH